MERALTAISCQRVKEAEEASKGRSNGERTTRRETKMNISQEFTTAVIL
jgi:hypothetical protein